MKNVKMGSMKMGSNGEKCSCDARGWLFYLVGLVVLALGFLLLVEGFLTQMEATSFWATLFLYLLGLGALKTGRLLKAKGCGSCAVHGGHSHGQCC